MEKAGTEDVQRLYEKYPYPHSVDNLEPDLLLSYVFRGHFLLDPLSGWRILDAGCGTGHKLAGLAAAYPQAQFLGIELSGASVAVARDLIEHHRLSNVEVRQGNILELTLEEQFDVVNAFGVVHHLEDPQRGLNNLCRLAKDDGIVSLWFYHPLGESERLGQRELLLTLWGGNRHDMAEGQTVMEQLGLYLEPTHYGPRYGARNGREANPSKANADAFMHPIVFAYRFGEAIAMLRTAGMEWAAVDFVNLPGAVKLIDLSEVKDPYTVNYCIGTGDLLASQELQERYRALPKTEQLKIIELILRPRGFQILAGKGQGYARLGQRVRGNMVHLGASQCASR
jgi:SAM-dependent methyltransferase